VKRGRFAANEVCEQLHIILARLDGESGRRVCEDRSLAVGMCPRVGMRVEFVSGALGLVKRESRWFSSTCVAGGLEVSRALSCSLVRAAGHGWRGFEATH
jgi:hypothetical protein